MIIDGWGVAAIVIWVVALVVCFWVFRDYRGPK